jgi:hypothetical protein
MGEFVLLDIIIFNNGKRINFITSYGNQLKCELRAKPANSSKRTEPPRVTKDVYHETVIRANFTGAFDASFFFNPSTQASMGWRTRETAVDSH